jgi:DNA-binding MarR family transcriptional regulator
MDVQEQLVQEGLTVFRDLIRSVLASKFHHHPHTHSFYAPTEDALRPEGCPEGADSLEASSGVEWGRPDGVPEAQIKLVVHLALHGPQTMSEVADGLEVTTPAVTGLVDKLEKRGLVERVRDSQDRRVVRVRLAPHAQQMAEKHLAERQRRMRLVLETLTPEEQRKFIHTLRLLAQTYFSRPGGEVESE